MISGFGINNPVGWHISIAAIIDTTDRAVTSRVERTAVLHKFMVTKLLGGIDNHRQAVMGVASCPRLSLLITTSSSVLDALDWRGMPEMKRSGPNLPRHAFVNLGCVLARTMRLAAMRFRRPVHSVYPKGLRSRKTG